MAQDFPFSSSNDPFSNKSEDESSYTPSNEPAELSIDDDESMDVQRGACVAVVIIALLLAIGGVSVWYFLYRDKAPAAEETTPPVTQADPNMIQASTGGRVAYTDANGQTAEVIIPPNALSQDTRIQIIRVSSGTVTDLYHLTPDGLKFLKPVTVSIPYKKSGLLESQTAYDIVFKYWKSLYSSSYRSLNYDVNEEARTLKTQVSEF